MHTTLKELYKGQGRSSLLPLIFPVVQAQLKEKQFLYFQRKVLLTIFYNVPTPQTEAADLYFHLDAVRVSIFYKIYVLWFDIRWFLEKNDNRCMAYNGETKFGIFVEFCFINVMRIKSLRVATERRCY